MASLNLFKLALKSYVKRMEKVNFFKKISLFRHADNFFNSHFHKSRSCRNSVRALKPDNQRKGRW